MSYKEKSIAASLVILIYIWGNYLVEIITLEGQDVLTIEAVNGLLFAVVIKTIVLEIFLQTVVAIIDHKNASAIDDERDKLIRLKSAVNAYWILSIGIPIAVFHTIVPSGVLSFEVLGNDYAVVHIIMFCAVLAEIIRLSSKLYFYHRGF